MSILTLSAPGPMVLRCSRVIVKWTSIERMRGGWMLELDSVHVVPSAARAVRRDHPALILGVIGAVIGFAGSWIPSYWGDEAASVLSATRTWPSLAAMLGNVDGVHGLYYALLHVWIRVFGPSEPATRALSAIAVGFAVAGTVVLVREFASTRMAVVAGILCAVLPRTTYMAAEARSYALGAAVAVWATVLMMRLLRGSAARRWWFAYAVAIAVGIYVFLYLGLLLAVHGVFVAVLHRRALTRWAQAAGISLLLAAPIIAVGYRERRQIRFLQRRHYATAAHVLTKQWFGYPLLAVAAWLLIAVAILWLFAALRRRRPDDDGVIALTLLAALWLSIPTTALLVTDAAVSPVYNVRYLSFCAPAAAILMALGVRAVSGLAAPARRSALATLLVGALLIGCAPAYLGQRSPWAKDGGSDWRAVADYVHSNAVAGAALIFDQSTKPSRDPRIALDLSPESFVGLRDVALETPYANRAHLWDRTSPNAQAAARLTGAGDVWAIELTTSSAPPADVVLLEDLGYELESSQLIHRTTVYHLVKE